ncbi:MAG TPA: hypothetical protein VNA20_11745 [Frankiaceae bacterium]|nr:hypothetical protein [Frankiaceae bacterium]
MEESLPDGWSLARVREYEPDAVLLDPAAHYVVVPENGDWRPVTPTAIVNVLDLCLCLLPRDERDAAWWMGRLDRTDGHIELWGVYGDLESAVRAL